MARTSSPERQPTDETSVPPVIRNLRAPDTGGLLMLHFWLSWAAVDGGVRSDHLLLRGPAFGIILAIHANENELGGLAQGVTSFVRSPESRFSWIYSMSHHLCREF